MSFAYLGVLGISLLGLGVVDWRWKLALFSNRNLTLKAVGLGVVFFSLWDLAGIGLHIFFPGSSPYVTGVMLLPGYPLEELFFLTLLNYQALLLWRIMR